MRITTPDKSSNRRTSRTTAKTIARAKHPSQPIASTPIESCVQKELRRYFELLDGQDPADLYRLVIRQAEAAMLNEVMKECGGNQSKAATWLGISRGNLRKKLADMDYDKA